METAKTGWERAKKSLETDRTALRSKLDALEDRCSEMNVKIMNVENLERRLNGTERQLVEKSTRITDLEADNRTLAQQVRGS